MKGQGFKEADARRTCGNRRRWAHSAKQLVGRLRQQLSANRLREERKKLIEERKRLEEARRNLRADSERHRARRRQIRKRLKAERMMLLAERHYPLRTEVGNYRIEGLLGFSSRFRVYLARDVRSGRKVALKMAKNQRWEHDFRELAQRQPGIGVSFDHPNILQADAGEVEGQRYTTTNYVAGSDLEAILSQEGPLSVSRTVRIVAQVADALDSLHARGIFHGDVAPSNVLIGVGDTAYVIDFLGLGPRANRRRTAKSSDYPHRDIYRLGWLLYSCLSGLPSTRQLRDRWNGKSIGELQDLLDHVPFDLSEGQRGAIAKALVTEPANGYPTCASLITAIRDNFR
jgi:hypothetical protein